MNCNKVSTIFFSATGTTKKIIKTIENGIGIKETEQFDITCGFDHAINIPSDTLAIFGIPVYSGRVPQIAAENLKKFSGNGTPAIIVCVYGNRDFDDAILELRDIVEKNNFHIISAGAFIAQHSIFPKVAHNRPDTLDLNTASEFGSKSMALLSQCKDISKIPQLHVKGNHPYRNVASIPLKPKTNNKCNACKLCVKQCPTGAICEENPHKIEKTKCICCAHCISICNRNAKYFGGPIYWIASRKFSKKFSHRQEPDIVYSTCFL